MFDFSLKSNKSSFFFFVIIDVFAFKRKDLVDMFGHEAEDLTRKRLRRTLNFPLHQIDQNLLPFKLVNCSI